MNSKNKKVAYFFFRYVFVKTLFASFNEKFMDLILGQYWPRSTVFEKNLKIYYVNLYRVYE